MLLPGRGHCIHQPEEGVWKDFFFGLSETMLSFPKGQCHNPSSREGSEKGPERNVFYTLQDYVVIPEATVSQTFQPRGQWRASDHQGTSSDRCTAKASPVPQDLQLHSPASLQGVSYIFLPSKEQRALLQCRRPHLAMGRCIVPPPGRPQAQPPSGQNTLPFDR